MSKFRYVEKKTNLNRNQIDELFKKEVLDSANFNEHVREVSFKTKIDEEIVKDILTSYFTNILVVINTIRKIKTKINVYGFFFLKLMKGNQIKN